ncbi:MAG: hypothetical protein GY838_15660 [bacterium]|nr:hypothetical protein [bacterium]
MSRPETLQNRAVAVVLAAICLQAFVAPAAMAQDKCVYDHVQILVPGEEPAPYTASGKTGTPLPQTVGVPFQVRVRVTNDNYVTWPGVTHTLGFYSSDTTADLPPGTPLVDGELTTWVTLNTEGQWTVKAKDLTDREHKYDVSAPITATSLQPEPTTLVISGVTGNQTAGRPVTVTIETRRADGSLDTSHHGTVDLHQLTSLGQGVLSPGTINLAAGAWTGHVTFFLADPAGESVRLKAVKGGIEGLSDYFGVGPGPYARLLALAPGQNFTPWILEGINGEPTRQWCGGPFPVDVYATDEYWNRVDVSYDVVLESGDSEADTPLTVGLENGHNTVDVTMNTPGGWFLAVHDPARDAIGGFVSRDVPVHYSHLQVLLPGEDPAPGTETGKTGEPAPQVAGIPFPVTIRACNADFESVPTDRVVVRLGTTDDTATLPAAEPVLDGSLTVMMAFNSSGTFTVTAEDIVGPEYYTTTSAPVSVSGSTGIVSALTVDSMGALQTAGEPATVTIRAVDAAGDQVFTHAGAVNLTQLTSQDRGSLAPGEITLTGGAWTGPVTFHLADPASRLEAVSQNDFGVTGTSNEFQVQAGALARLVAVLPGQHLMPATEGGLLGGPAAQTTGYPFAVTLHTTDTWWNLVAVDHTVGLTSLDPAASTPQQAQLSGGFVSVPVTFGSAGNWTLTATDLTDGAAAPMTTVPFSVLSSTPDFVIDPLPSPVTAGVPVTVTIRTHDPQGGLLDGYNGFAMLAADTGPETVTPATVQFSGGRWTGQVTFFGAAEDLALKCIDFASPPNLGASDPFTVLPGAFAGLQVLLPGQENVGGRDPGYEGEPREQEAGQPFTVTVNAVDTWWNPIEEGDTAVALAPTDPFALAVRDTNLTDGRLIMDVTYLRAGDHTLAAVTDVPDMAGYTSDEFHVKPGPYARIITLAPGEELLSGSELGKAGLALDQSISYTFPLRVLATDPWWNPVTGVFDEIRLVCTDPLSQVPDVFSLVDGAAEVNVRLSTAGYQLMTLTNISVPDMDPAHTQMRAIETGFHMEAEIQPAQVVAGEPFTLSVRVVNDAGAVMQDINGMATVAVLNATTGEPGQGELLDGSFQFHQGRRSITQTYTRSEPIVILVSSVLGDDPGLTNVLTVVPGAPAALDFHETSDWVGGLKTTDVTAKVSDRLGNGIPELPVEFSTAIKTALEILDSVTDADGLAHARYTGTATASTAVIEVRSVGFSNSMQIRTALIDPTSGGGLISNYPNPFHPGDGATTVIYTLSRDAAVTWRLYTLTGTLALERTYPAGAVGGTQGINEVPWDGRNGDNSYVASGGYILDVQAERQGETIHKMRRRIAVVR